MERIFRIVKSWDAEKFLAVETPNRRPTNCYPFRIIWNSKKLLPQVVFFLECRKRLQSSRVFPIRFSCYSYSLFPFFLLSSDFVSACNIFIEYIHLLALIFFHWHVRPNDERLLRCFAACVFPSFAFQRERNRISSNRYSEYTNRTWIRTNDDVIVLNSIKLVEVRVHTLNVCNCGKMSSHVCTRVERSKYTLQLASGEIRNLN